MTIPRVSGWPSFWGERGLALLLALALGAASGLVASRLSVTLSLAIVVGLPLLVLASVLVFRYPQASFLGLLLFGPFNYSYMYLAPLRGRDPTAAIPSAAATPLEQSLKDGIYLFLLGLWLLRLLVKKDLRLHKGPLDLPVALFVVYILFRFVTSEVQAGWGSAVALRNMVEYVPLYFIAASLLDRPQWVKRAVYVVIAAGVAVSLLGLYEFMVSGSYYWTAVPIGGSYLPRAASTLNNPLNLGPYLVVVMALALGVLSCHRKASRWLRASLLPITLCLVLTFTRSAYVGALAAVAAMGLAAKNRRLLLVLAVSLTLLSLVAVAFFPSFLGQWWGESLMETGIGHRLSIVGENLEQSMENPLLGLGLGRAGNLVAAERLGSEREGYGTDNYYTVLLVQTGLLGLGLFLAIILQAVWVSLGAFRRLADPFLRGVALAIFSLLLVFLFYGAVIQLWENYPINLYFWTLMGLLTSLRRMALQERPHPSGH